MSITLKQERCGNCAAPLGAPLLGVLECAYCGSCFSDGPPASFRIPPWRPYPHPPTLGTVWVGSTPYRVHGLLGRGSASDVFLARRDRATSELVVLKVARTSRQEVALRAEWELLGQLRGHGYLRRLLGGPRQLARLRSDGSVATGRLTAVYGWRSGFSFTLEQVRSQYPAGVEPPAIVWLWNRILEQLQFLHGLGYAHNALLPEHLLVHCRDHAVAFCGWSAASQQAPASDLSQSASCLGALLPAQAPAPLRDLLQGAGEFERAATLQKELQVVARRLFGQPRYHSFTLA